MIYDYGDSWTLKIKLEKSISKNDTKPFQSAVLGEGCGIIEDCESVGRLEELMHVFFDSEGESYESYRLWLGKSILIRTGSIY
jgi:hypothetical protein